MPPVPRSALPLGPPRRRRAPAVVAVVALLFLGGAVAGGYGTGLALGTRIAPPRDVLVAEPQTREADPARPPEPDETGQVAEPGDDGEPADTSVTGTGATTPDGIEPGATTPSRSTVIPAPTTPGANPTPPDPPASTNPPDPPDPLPPPGDPMEATRRLVGAAASGDVDQVWELLTPFARIAAGDRHALATRLTDLHDRLAPVRDGAPLTVTTLTTERGVVTVVAPILAGAGAPIALPFVTVDGRPRLAAIDPPPGIRWIAPSDDEADLVVAGTRRPSQVAVDGTQVDTTPVDARALRVPVAALSEGSHQAVAVFVDGRQLTASAFEFTTRPRPIDDPDEPLGPAPIAVPEDETAGS